MPMRCRPRECPSSTWRASVNTTIERCRAPEFSFSPFYAKRRPMVFSSSPSRECRERDVWELVPRRIVFFFLFAFSAQRGGNLSQRTSSGLFEAPLRRSSHVLTFQHIAGHASQGAERALTHSHGASLDVRESAAHETLKKRSDAASSHHPFSAVDLQPSSALQ